MRREHNSEDDLKPENPRRLAGWLSALTFWYTLKTFRAGYKHDLTESDLTKPLPEHKSALLGNRISIIWSKEVDRAEAYGEQPRMGVVIVKCFYADFLIYGLVLVLVELGIRMFQPLFMGLLLRYFNANNVENTLPPQHPMYLWRVWYYWTPGQSPIQYNEAIVFAIGIISCSTIFVLVLHPYMMAVMHLGMKIRIACCSLIYRKALRININILGGQTVGNVVNLMSNDVNRFDIAPIFIHYIWIAPLQVLIALYFLYREIGLPGIYGLSAIVGIIPMQALLGYRLSILRRKTAARTDNRVREMNEIIQAIEVIKMYAWEEPFSAKIDKTRKREIHVLKHTSFIRGIIMSFIMFTARFSIFLTILTYVLMGYRITAERVFVITSVYQILRQSMTVYFPQAIAQTAEVAVAVNRIHTFMVSEESDVGDPTPIDPHWRIKPQQWKYKNQKSMQLSKLLHRREIVIQEAYAKYGDDVVLENISLTIIPGQLTALIGPVGSGKSCLLNLVLGELRPYEGSVLINGIIAYAAQEPWLFAGSVRQNILFGQQYDRSRYREVIKVCALVRDFTILPYGDRTIVGERGISLSGGQRARVNLARAVYKVADIYLLDDPLSAVDTQVGKQLFDECIRGYLKEKVVILATHQLQYLKNVQQLVIMDSGQIVETGSYASLQESGLNFAMLLTEPVGVDETAEKSEVQNIIDKISMNSAFSAMAGSVFNDLKYEEYAEMRTRGAVTSYIYRQYFGAGANCFVLFILALFFIGAQAIASGGDYFLSQWVKLEERKYIASLQRHELVFKYLEDFSTQQCYIVYGLLIIGTVIIALTRSFLFFTVCMRASVKLHNRMFRSVCRATMRFFSTNTSGRILNRFSKDLGAIDEFLPNAMIDTFQVDDNGKL